VLCSQSVSHTSIVIGRPVVFERWTMGAAGASETAPPVSPPACTERCSTWPFAGGAAGFAAAAGALVGWFGVGCATGADVEAGALVTGA
jgi:hypothetical protein